jgi:hypothetical protein
LLRNNAHASEDLQWIASPYSSVNDVTYTTQIEDFESAKISCLWKTKNFSACRICTFPDAPHRTALRTSAELSKFDNLPLPHPPHPCASAREGG